MQKRKPSRRLYMVWGIYAFIFAFLLILIALALPAAWRSALLLCGAGVILLAAVYACLRFRFMAYAVDPTHLTVWGGVFFRSEKQVPQASIRYVTALYGIPERLCGVCTLIVYVNGGMLLLEGLQKDTAATLQKQLLKVADHD